MISSFSNKVVLVTGGTGTLGTHIVKALIKRGIKKVIVYSRDERKQVSLRRELGESKNPRVRYFIGDIRDGDRLRRAFTNVDYVIHTAAMKHVDVAEYNPFECVKTNIVGVQNIIDAAIDMNVKRILAISSDKAVNPINLYGATKLVSDKMFLSAHSYVGSHGPKFSVIRFGNFIGSRGSVMEFWKTMYDSGCRTLPVTDGNMTRFWIEPEEATLRCLDAILFMSGQEIFFPRMDSRPLSAMAKEYFENCDIEIIGRRPGEKIHEEITYNHHIPRIEWNEGIQLYVTYPDDRPVRHRVSNIKISSEG